MLASRCRHRKECCIRLRLVALLLTTAIIALLVGWALDRHRYITVLQIVITEHVTGNVNIQSAWTRSELAGTT